MKQINQLIGSFSEKKLLIILTIAGLAFSFVGYRLLNGYPYNFGPNVIGVFIPPVSAILYLSIVAVKRTVNFRVLFTAILLFSIQSAPYFPLLFQEFQPTPGDDFSRYYLYAKNMYDHHTLWGGDKLFFKDAGNHFVTQPGYRYLVLLELILFRRLYLFILFFNTVLYVLTVWFFFRALPRYNLSSQFRNGLVFLVLLFTPYLIKNQLMGLPEWVAVILLMWSCVFYAGARDVPAVLLLALVPFFRQNLLIAILLLFAVLFARKKTAITVALFFAVVLLPVYHNLYYAGSWRFFVDIFELPFVNRQSGFNFTLLVGNLIHYFGFDIENQRLTFSFPAILFLPFAVWIGIKSFSVLHSRELQAILLLIVLSAVIPALLLGSAYFPRFELANTAIFMTGFLFCFSTQKSKQLA